MQSSKHPIERFHAPLGITTGQPLKDLFTPKLVGLIGESLANVHASFDTKRFKKNACDGLSDGTLMQRAAHIADALAIELPDDFEEASEILVASMGPEQRIGEGDGLRGFFYQPMSFYVSNHGTERFEAGMTVNYELTKRYTSEFCIRPFLERHQRHTLARLKKWTKDPNPHVRRLCSEGSRPRLPWASRLPALQQDPSLAWPILQALKDDDELYVRRSVANHLGDILKDHADVVYDLCATWLDEIERLPEERAKNRKWMIRHAVRLPAKKGERAALDLRVAAK